MDLVIELFQRLNSLEELIRWGGYLVLVAIVFAETGLLIGFFLPGDSLLVTAGLLASTGALDIRLLNLLLSAAAIAGDSVGYYIGHKSGPRIFTREKSLLFARDHLVRTKAFYEKHGGKTIVIARFVPIIRTFAPVVAGVGQMAYRRFVSYNVFGGIFWVGSMTLVGYFLGRTIPAVQDYIHVVIAIVIVLSILPGVFEVVRARLAARRRLSAQGPH
ncbi:MAG: VTT domain-containing protein [Deltaproteobacteria bacterium]|nr:VTT domain-containing protein [Deltaproteobacteria bacterium]MBI3077471.1 VTT domain-containing protein [Deltaproteobacteria bacterium]